MRRQEILDWRHDLLLQYKYCQKYGIKSHIPELKAEILTLNCVLGFKAYNFKVYRGN